MSVSVCVCVCARAKQRHFFPFQECCTSHFVCFVHLSQGANTALNTASACEWRKEEARERVGGEGRIARARTEAGQNVHCLLGPASSLPRLNELSVLLLVPRQVMVLLFCVFEKKESLL